MTIEETVISGVLGGIIGAGLTYFGFRLQRAEQRAERTELEDRLRALLAGEVEQNLSNLAVFRQHDGSLDRTAAHSPPPPYEESRTAYKALQANPTALPAGETSAVNMFFTSLDLMRYSQEHPPKARDPDVERAMWATTSTFVEQCGIAALKTLGASESLQRLKQDANWEAKSSGP